MNKKLLKRASALPALLWLMLLAILPAQLSARDFDYTFEGQTLTYTTIDAYSVSVKGNRISNYAGVVIPEKATDNYGNTYTVTSVGDNAFNGCKYLTDLFFPETVTEIGEGAFRGCSILTALHLPNSLASIRFEAFRGCSSLRTVMLPNSVRYIDVYVFADCIALEKAAYPSSIKDPFYCNNTVEYPADGEYIFDTWGGTIMSADKTELYFVAADVINFTIPNTVTTIGDSAFKGCRSLSSIDIPNSVTSIGNSAFKGCEQLRSIDMSNSVTSIGNEAFSDCGWLESIIIPNSVKSIGKDAFSNCSSNIKLAYPSSLDYFPISYNNSIKYPDDAIIEDGCIWKADKTELYYVPLNAKGEFIIPNSVTLIGRQAFRNCSGLTSVIIPDSVTVIKDSAFKNCSGLTSVIIPNSVEMIEADAFYNCSGLIKLAHPSRINTSYWWHGIAIEYPADVIIEDGFIWTADKSELLFVPLNAEGILTIPNSVISIGDNAFFGCDALTELNVEGSIPAVFADNTFPNYNLNVTVPAGTLVDYMDSDWFKFPNLKDVAGFETTIFSDGIFNYRRINDKEAALSAGDYKSMTTVSIPERVVYDGKFVFVTAIADAFTDCSNITSLVLPKSLERIYFNAFKGCTGLTDINFPATVTSIGNSSFEGCTGLTKLNLPESLTTIGNSAFKGCTGLTDINFPATLTSIGNSCFQACSSLTSVELPALISTINDNTFQRCSALTSITVPETLTAIGNNAFEFCGKLTDITIPDGVTSIGDNAFFNCNSFASFTPGKALESVGESAFYGCKALTDVKVTWSNIAKFTFSNTGLTNLELTNAVQSIGASAFGYTKLPAISIPASVKSIDTYAFTNVGNSSNGIDLILEDGIDMIDIEALAFKDTPISSIHIGRDLDSYESFSSNVKNVVFGNTVKAIPANAFNGNSSLNAVSFGSSIETIGENAFNGCALTELVLPPHVKTIGNNAFAANAIKNIAIGSEVTEIGEKAFDGSNQLAGVSITAITPPMANNNTFSYYDCPLYVTPGCVDTYYNFIHCWYRFSGHDLIPAEKVEIADKATITLKPGEKLQLSAAVAPANASLPYIFWRSSNPEFATVDAEGNVTRVDNGGTSALADEDEDMNQSCRIYAETLYADIAASITVMGQTVGVDEIEIEDTEAERPNDIFTLQGICIKRDATQADIENLAPGLYIIAGRKVLVK